MKYCAFLRGVNVKGTNMKMADVCKVFSDAGVENVSSVLASGNILFQSDKNNADLKKILEKAMSDHFSYDAFLFIKNEKEINEIFKNDPFPAKENFHNYVFLGSEKVEETLLEEFEKATKEEGEQGKIVNEIFYWQVPKGQTLDSTFGKILGRKSLKDKMTSRNINTFERIIKKF
ncbi:DUF1697 domain-containing protein [Epilithonimonas sp. JDS]|uniref:DUF1697 domain-containing protein n=1 Tax=Epilithonimonas sp. JDS TaxID=2902797 RepID=UPI001E64E5E6|nr:DUF1697 domain-containing protein [Epilithonimonas sp. JDS]MCD9854911.1 DUF1697 domain-containing protein [Epilithonimonas sp. JDS]